MPQPYSPREIEQLFKAADARSDEFRYLLMDRMDGFENKTTSALSRIELQTTRTNGRVNDLESWQSMVIGFCACVTILILPLLFIFAKSYFKV